MRTRAFIGMVLAIVMGLGWWAVPARAGDDGVTATQEQNDLLKLVRRFHDHHAHHPHLLVQDSILQREAREHSGELAAHDEDDFGDFGSHAQDIHQDEPSIAINEICGAVARVGGIPTNVAGRLFDLLRQDPAGHDCMLDLDGFRSNRIGVSVKFNNSRFYATLIMAREHR